MAFPIAIPWLTGALKAAAPALAHTAAILGLGALGKEVYDRSRVEENEKTDEERKAEVAKIKEAIISLPAVDRMSKLKQKSSFIVIPQDNTNIETAIQLKRKTKKKKKKSGVNTNYAETPSIDTQEEPQIDVEIDVEENEGVVPTDVPQDTVNVTQDVAVVPTPQNNNEDNEERDDNKPSGDKKKNFLKRTYENVKDSPFSWPLKLTVPVIKGVLGYETFAAPVDVMWNTAVGYFNPKHTFNPAVMTFPLKAIKWVYDTSGMDNALNSSNITINTGNNTTDNKVPVMTNVQLDSMLRAIQKEDSAIINRGFKQKHK